MPAAAPCRGDHTRTLQKLGEMPFVPTERFRLQLCATGGRGGRGRPATSLLQAASCAKGPRPHPLLLASMCAVQGRPLAPLNPHHPTGVSSLHPAVADRLPAVLLAAAAALAASGKREQLQTLVAFASAVPNRISQSAYQQLNQLQASVA